MTIIVLQVHIPVDVFMGRMFREPRKLSLSKPNSTLGTFDWREGLNFHRVNATDWPRTAWTSSPAWLSAAAAGSEPIMRIKDESIVIVPSVA